VKRIIAAALVLASAAMPIEADADSITYDFTGSVTSALGNWSGTPEGSIVTGTFTFDYQNAIIANGSISSGPPWNAAESNGPLIFSSTGTVNGITNASANIGTSIVKTVIDIFSAREGSTQGNSEFSFSQPGPIGSVAASNGGPVFNSVLDSGTGSFADASGDQINYTLTSLTPVPLPAAAWLLLSALGGLGVAGRRRLAA
jgi:hypothetical protein